MPNNKKKHIKPFWAILCVVVAALVAGGLIYFYAIGNELQDDVYSITFNPPIQIQKMPKKPVTAINKSATLSKAKPVATK